MSWQGLFDFAVDMGDDILGFWLMVAVAFGILFGVGRRYFQPRKVQDVPWEWAVFRHELLFSALTVGAAAATIGVLWGYLRRTGHMTFASEPAAWYTNAFEFAIYFFAFDFYFYAVHRLMHVDPLYRWVHKTHHRSTAPTPLTSFSFNPVEGMLTGGFLPLFLATFEVHRSSLALIAGFQPLMSIFVHSGHEIFPRWWYQSRWSSWFLTSMFHDQHHQYYHCNYGGFTTIWDRVFGTVNPTFEDDFARHKAKLERPRGAAPPTLGTAGSEA